jgi:hypothetical protein
VFVVSFDGPILALDAATGAVEWSREHSYWLSAEPTYADGVVYLNGGGSGGALMALEADSGSASARDCGAGCPGSRVCGAPPRGPGGRRVAVPPLPRSASAR